MFGYVLFALMLGSGLILYRFPYDSLSKRLEAEASQRLGCDLDIEELGFQFPLSLGFSRVSIESPDLDLLKEMVVNSGKIRIRPLALVSRKVGLGVKGDFLAVSLQGSIELSPLLEPEYFECAHNWRDRPGYTKPVHENNPVIQSSGIVVR